MKFIDLLKAVNPIKESLPISVRHPETGELLPVKEIVRYDYRDDIILVLEGDKTDAKARLSVVGQE